MNGTEKGNTLDAQRIAEKEKIGMMMTQPVARIIALHSDSGGADILKPQKIEDQTLIQKTKSTLEDSNRTLSLNYQPLEELSDKGRKEYWERKKQEDSKFADFNEQKKLWNEDLRTWILELKEDSNDSAINVLNDIGFDINDETIKDQALLTQQVDTFYVNYLKGGSKIKAFVEDIAEKSPKKDQESLDLGKFEKRLTAIQDLLVVFGKDITNNAGEEKKDVINNLINDYAKAHGLLTQKDKDLKKEIAQKVTAQLAENVTDVNEQTRLTILYENIADIASSEPVQPEMSDIVPAPTAKGIAFDSQEHEEKKNFHPLVEDAGGDSDEDGTAPHPWQDRFFVDREHGAFGVFDGLGSYDMSHEAAEDASTLLAEALAAIEDNPDVAATQNEVREAVIQVSKKIAEKNRQRFEKRKIEIEKTSPTPLTIDELRVIFSKSCGVTTASIVKLWRGPNGEKKAIVANVGDSRVYLQHEDTLTPVTLDDSVIDDEIPIPGLRELFGEEEAKRIQFEQASAAFWNKDLQGKTTVLHADNEHHRKLLEEINWGMSKKFTFDHNGEVKVPLSKIDLSIISQSLGSIYLQTPERFLAPQPRMDVFDITSGDRIILTTDGVHDTLSIGEIEHIVKSVSDIKQAPRAMLDEVNRMDRIPGHRGKADDKTAVVVAIK